ncbi:MAG TPA: hypothetical protein VGC25_10520 [Alphaproteobacteria bacterium]|jgi:uncharacterized protein Usg
MRYRPRNSLELQLLGYRLATAEIIYRMPDHLDLLQSYIWQDFDIAPEFPVLRRFLDFWSANLDGPIHAVRVASASLVKPAEFQMVEDGLRLN